MRAAASAAAPVGCLDEAALAQLWWRRLIRIAPPHSVSRLRQELQSAAFSLTEFYRALALRNAPAVLSLMASRQDDRGEASSPTESGSIGGDDAAPDIPSQGRDVRSVQPDHPTAADCRGHSLPPLCHRCGATLQSPERCTVCGARHCPSCGDT